MGLLIDSNVFITAERSRESGKLAELLATISIGHENDEALISVVTASELEMGVHRAVNEQRRERRRAFVEAILSQFAIANIDLRVARCHAQIVANLMAAGQSIGTHDSWIGATALAYGHSLVTANIGEFQRIPGLVVIPFQLGS